MMDPNSLYRAHGMVPPRTAAQRGLQPKFVKFAPGDRGDHLPDIFFEDPRVHKPKPGPLGQIHAWGLLPQMTTQSLYAFGRHVRPERQFMEVIIDRKKKELKKHDFNGLEKCDVICKIFLTGMLDKHGNPRIWRRFKVSAGISLQALQDKVVAPLMGWVRNLHCYTFTDFRDGALFGPEHSSSIDVAHKAQVGYEYLPDDRYKFAHLFSKEGDEVGYLYDFGDKWFHQINIEKIIPPEQSTGAVEVLEGKGMCPGENMKGCLNYIDTLEDYDKGNTSKRAQIALQVLQSPNYKSFGKPIAQFDPSSFDLVATKARVAEALNTTNSVRTGAKQFTVPFVPQSQAFHNQTWLRDNVSFVMQHDDDDTTGAGHWRETMSETKDKLRVAVCAACGKPASAGVDLKTCSGCRKVMYCSVAHQKDHWKVLHKKQCTKEFLKQKEASQADRKDQSHPAAAIDVLARSLKLDDLD
ncbi:hypothetical protein CVT24_012246 [Panaeolus cyanescens]|uniref:MYND-type domain-containing protein n=1 Tax=Panaeolus cyanescens TaxID=181874 RepID=A0A409W5S6_9AGAR|nr:hypothetical protein CVT24_012246 [Panaeolus cyanescens]